MPDTWERHPLLADFNLTGGEQFAAYAPQNVTGWRVDRTGAPDVADVLTMLTVATTYVDRAVPIDSPDEAASLDRVDDLISARLLASAAAAVMTKVRAWAVYSTYAGGFGEIGERRIVWSSHFSEVDAGEWLTAWSEHYADNASYEWHTALMPVDVGTLRRPGARPIMPAR